MRKRIYQIDDFKCRFLVPSSRLFRKRLNLKKEEEEEVIKGLKLGNLSRRSGDNNPNLGESFGGARLRAEEDSDLLLPVIDAGLRLRRPDHQRRRRLRGPPRSPAGRFPPREEKRDSDQSGDRRGEDRDEMAILEEDRGAGIRRDGCRIEPPPHDRRHEIERRYLDRAGLHCIRPLRSDRRNGRRRTH